MTSERRQQFLQHFGRRVRAARILRGLTLQECADQAGISYSNLSVIERGRRSMYVEHLPALASVLNVTAQYLLGEEALSSDAGSRAMAAENRQMAEAHLPATQPTRRRKRQAAPVA